LADLPNAKLEQREAAYPDPDVTMVQIDVDVKGPEMDDGASKNNKEPYYHLYTAMRKFPNNVTQPFALQVKFLDASVIKFGDITDLGDLPLPVDNAPLPLPSSRDIRIRVTPVCTDDPTLKYFGSQQVRFGKFTTIYARADALDERNLFIPTGPAKQFQSIFLQPDPLPTPNTDAVMRVLALGDETPANLMQRLADQLELNTKATTLFAKPGQRVVFGCAKGIRHTLSPEHGSITFASKADLIHQWIATIVLDIKRDWSWDGLQLDSFEISRQGIAEPVGIVEVTRTLPITAIQDPDRSFTRIIFFDAVDPKDFPGPFPQPQDIQYTISGHFKSAPAQQDADKIVMMTVPVTIPPSQIPKIVSAGIALSPYAKSDNYSTTGERKKVLWIEFEEPVQNPDDDYFAFVKAYSPDPILIPGKTPVADPKENIPFLPAELIRVIVNGQSDDRAGWNARQVMVPCTEISPRHFIVPLPPGLSPGSKELFGFFTYEFCLGHSRVWSTAQGRYGRPLRVTGVQHPSPSLSCTTNRTDAGVTMNAEFAIPVLNGQNLLGNYPQTELWGILYTQVAQADGAAFRNILLNRRQMYPLRKDNYYFRAGSVNLNATCAWSDDEIKTALLVMGLHSNAPLSVLAVEMFKNFEVVGDPLGSDLGKMRIYRTSRLVPVPQIC
jgi:hypothetical protein